jgi:photosystem II stability/assembly factor-like uncharacterized protein
VAQTPTLYTGTIGQSVWRSRDGGESWQRASNGLFPEADIRAIAVNPNDSAILYTGTESGIFRTKNGGNSWERLESEIDGLQVWSIAINPKNPDVVYAGTCPSALFRSSDSGNTWQKLNADLAEECEGVSIVPRVTTIIVDPEDDQTVYAGIEIDGMRISRDGGDTWTEGSEGLSSLDIHGLTVVPGSTKTLVAGTNNDVCLTTDMAHWTPLNVKAHIPWSYCRGVLYLGNGSNRVYVGAGNGPPGNEGGLFYTDDLGGSWGRADLGGDTNSTVWAINHNPAVPDWLIAYSVAGQLFRSTDNGKSWTRLEREFGEVRGMAIAP